MLGKLRYKALGLMSGTSMDAIDVALLETDGEEELQAGAWTSQPVFLGVS